MRTNLLATIIFFTMTLCLQHQARTMKLHQKPRAEVLKKLKNFRRQERIWEDAQQKKFLHNKAAITVDDNIRAPDAVELDKDLCELIDEIAFLENDAQETRDQKIFLATTIPLFLNCRHAYFMRLLLELARVQGRNIFVKMVTAPLHSGATKLHNAVARQQPALVHEILQQSSNLSRDVFLAVVSTPYHHTTPCYTAAMGDSLEIFQDFLIQARNLGPEAFRTMINVKRGKLSLVDYVKKRLNPQWFLALQEHANALHVNIHKTLHQSTYQKPLPVSLTSQCLLS